MLVSQLLIRSSHRELQYHLMLSYGFFTTMIFTTSTIYHISEFMFRPKRRRLRYYLHISDRAAIYCFIAASATPWLSLRHSGYLGLDLKYIVWLFAFMGIVYQLLFHERFKTIETLLYVINALIPYAALLTMNDRTGTPLVIFAGSIYALGVIFFKLDGLVPFAHSIWHLHVITASAIQAYAIYSSLLGPDKNNPFPD